MFSAPIMIGWMPYDMNKKKANPIGGMKSSSEIWKISSSN
jgi:hypothetical protein